MTTSLQLNLLVNKYVNFTKDNAMKLLVEVLCTLLMILLVAAFPWLLAVGVIIGMFAAIGSDARGRDEPGGDV